MLERTRRIGNRSRWFGKRPRIMTGSSSSSGYEIRRQLIQDMNITESIPRFIQTMNKKYLKSLPKNIKNSLDELIQDLEDDFKIFFGVDFIDYSDTDSESSSETPAPAKRHKGELKVSKPERYINNLERRIKKLIFAQDNVHGELFTTDIHKKLCFRRFLTESGLSLAEIHQCIITPSNT